MGFKEIVKEGTTSTSGLILAMLICLGGASWLLVDGVHPVLAGVGVGMCISQVTSLVVRFMCRREADKDMASTGKRNLDILAKHGLRAHFYLPAAGIEDAELAEALRRVSSAGYIITDQTGNQLMGKVASIPMTTNEIADMRRAEFKVVR